MGNNLLSVANVGLEILSAADSTQPGLAAGATGLGYLMKFFSSAAGHGLRPFEPIEDEEKNSDISGAKITNTITMDVEEIDASLTDYDEQIDEQHPSKIPVFQPQQFKVNPGVWSLEEILEHRIPMENRAAHPFSSRRTSKTLNMLQQR